MRHANGFLHVSAWLALAACCAQASARTADAGATWVPVGEEQLARMRGGVSLPSGLQVSLGIERLVSINGELVARTSFDISDLNHLSGEQLQQTREALSSVKLIQNGRDNIYQAGGASGVTGGVVIQNTLSDQLIQSQTVINSTVNSASLLKTLNFQGSLNDALTRAASGH